MKTIITAAILCLSIASAQETFPTQGPPAIAYQQTLGYTGSNVTYICYAKSYVGSATTSTPNRSAQVAVSAATNASPVVLTSTGHGFDVTSRPSVTISGATGTNWKTINGRFTATIINTNTFSIPVDSTTFGALTGTVVFTTTAPRLNVAEWAVKIQHYDGSGNLDEVKWLGGHSWPMDQKCSDATSTTIIAQ